MKTRTKNPSSKPPQSTSATETATAAAKLAALPPPEQKPPHITILPKDLSSNARVITLPYPATSTPSRYLIDPTKQRCYEFTKIAAPKRGCRSWLLAPTRQAGKDVAKSETRTDSDEQGYVIEKPDMMIATPVDPLFLILPALAADLVQNEAPSQMYLSSTDYLIRLEETSLHFKQLNRDHHLETLFETRIRAVCDSMDLGDGEILYRLSLSKLLGVLVEKARKVVEKRAWPESMEDKFVKQALAVPVANVRREESSVSLAKEETERSFSGRASQDQSESAGTQSQQDSQTSDSTVESTETAGTSVESIGPPSAAEARDDSNPETAHLLRLRTVLDYLLSSYVPKALHKPLKGLLQGPDTPFDFKSLDEYLAYLAKLKAEAAILRSLSDNISRKRSNIDEDDAEALERVETKKRKKEEEELRKKNVSRGVKKLEKVDRTGMKSLSSFFGAKAKS